MKESTPAAAAGEKIKSLEAEAESMGFHERLRFLAEAGKTEEGLKEWADGMLVRELESLAAGGDMVPGEKPTKKEAEALLAAHDAAERPSTEAKRAANVLIMAFYRSGVPSLKKWASDAFVTRNLGFVRMIINRSFATFKEKYEEDMTHVGVVAILENLDRFDPLRSKTGSSTTYFTYPVLNKISEYVNSETNRAGSYPSSLMNKVRKATRELEARGITDPIPFQIVAMTGLTLAQVNTGLKYIRYSDYVFLSEKEGSEEMLASKNSDPAVSVAASVMADERIRAVREAVDGLNDLERSCLRMKFGLGGGKPMSDKAIAKALGIKKTDAVTESLKKGLDALRHDMRLASLEQGAAPSAGFDGGFFDHGMEDEEFFQALDAAELPPAKVSVVAEPASA